MNGKNNSCLKGNVDFHCTTVYLSFFLLFAIPIYKHYQLSNKNTWFNKLMKDRGRICQTTFFSSVLSGNTGVIYVVSLFQFQVVQSCAIITQIFKTLFTVKLRVLTCVKVQIFWEGHTILKKSPNFFDVRK